MSTEQAAPCAHANQARLEMVDQLHTAVYGSTWARTETPEQVWEMLLAEVREAFNDDPNDAPCDCGCWSPGEVST